MSTPSFPVTPPPELDVPGGGGGAGDHLPAPLLYVCGACTAVGEYEYEYESRLIAMATVLSIISIVLQLKNYRMPALQRSVVRIMVMVPLYACSSLIALYSLNAAFFIDAIRDLYEAFVIYAFLSLLLTYLGGERELLLRLRGRPPIPHLFPVYIFLGPMDPSDPWTLINLKRGVLQYVQVKPLLVIATAILKATNNYHEGDFGLTSGYTWVTVVYNISICLSLYCLGMFWIAVNKDLQPFRPVPKFLCVKGILFFSFWQGVGISFLVSVGIITRVGQYTDPEHMCLALMDSMICIEMPFFAIAHQYAFQASDYIDTSIVHAARLPFVYAFRDAFGVKDVWEDIKYTFRARGVSYKAYEAVDGGLHHRQGRQKRIRAGLRYARGGQTKYWVPVPGEEHHGGGSNERAPLLPQHISPSPRLDYESDDSDASDVTTLSFSSVSEGEDVMYDRARRIGYAGFPNVDVSAEQARRRQREEEDGILAGKRTRRGTATLGNAASGPSTGRERGSTRNQRAGKSKPNHKVYGAWADSIAPTPGPVQADVDDAPFDGENENPGAWSDAPGTGTALRWTRKTANVRDGKPRPRPFVVHPEPEPVRRVEDVVEAEPDRARSDAVDLVSPTDIDRERSGRGKKRTSPPVQTEALSRREPSPPPPPPPQQQQQPRHQAPPPPQRTRTPSPPPSATTATTEESPARASFRPRGSPTRSFGSYRAPSYRWSNADDNPWA